MRIATQPKSNRLYKSRLFELIFRDKKELLQLYNAMNGTGGGCGKSYYRMHLRWHSGRFPK